MTHPSVSSRSAIRGSQSAPFQGRRTYGEATDWVPEVPRWSWWERMWSRFWAIPLALSLAGVLLGILLPEVDEAVWGWVPVLFRGGPEGAYFVLSAIATAMISVTGLVFSITMVVLQLASSQFTPRILSAFLDSRVTQMTLGMFTATFLYSLTVMRSVRDGHAEFSASVPQMATGVAFVFVLGSVGYFLAFIHHITSSIQVTNVIRDIALKTIDTVERMMPPADVGQDDDGAGAAGSADDPQEPRHAADEWFPTPGILKTSVVPDQPGDRVSDIDYRALVSVGSEYDIVIDIDSQLGDYVGSGTEIAHYWGRVEDPDAVAKDIQRAVWLAPARSMRQDVGFGIRQLVDIGDRALSPGTHDPATAVEVVNSLHRILARIVTRPAAPRQIRDADGVVRLVYRPQTAEQHIRLGVRELAVWGKETMLVPERLTHMLNDLLAISRPEYRDVIRDMRAFVADKEVKP